MQNASWHLTSFLHNENALFSFFIVMDAAFDIFAANYISYNSNTDSLSCDSLIFKRHQPQAGNPNVYLCVWIYLDPWLFAATRLNEKELYL